MKGGRKYRNPPVVEALCEIFFTGSNWDDTVPGRFYDQIKKEFPHKRQQEIREARIELGSTGEAATSVRSLAPRIQFSSEKKDKLIQLSRDMLVVNQLRPYPRFEDWEPILQKALEIYWKLTNPKGIQRIGVRYLNRVLIPLARIKMQDYFTVYPNIPTAAGNSHGTFMVRVEIPHQKGEHSVLLTFGTTPPDQPGQSAFMLDIYDSFTPDAPVPQKKVREEILNSHYNVETAFESSITERLRDVFDREEKS